jgi:hypothetical protein
MKRPYFAIWAFALVLTLIGLFYYCRCHPRDVSRCNFDQVRVGMTSAEVESLLGPGAEIPGESVAQVPPHVKPMRKGRFAPVIDGDVFFYWERDGIRIYVSYKDGHVFQKHYWVASL